jgi:hypothetical protein
MPGDPSAVTRIRKPAYNRGANVHRVGGLTLPAAGSRTAGRSQCVTTGSTSRRLTPSGRVPALLVLLALAVVGSGCGDGNEDNAVEAREQNRVELAGVRYRVVIFRELNPYASPDDALWTGEPPAEGTGLYAVVLRACGAGDGPAQATGEVHLEDAFGQRFEPRAAGTADPYEYQSRTLEPGECLPGEDDPADDTFGGAALVFAVPFNAAQERPLVLVLGDPTSGETARVQLDL